MSSLLLIGSGSERLQVLNVELAEVGLYRNIPIEGDRGEILVELVPTMMCHVGVEGLDDKFESVPGSGLKIYHTGDLGVMTDKGVVVVGRMGS